MLGQKTIRALVHLVRRLIERRHIQGKLGAYIDGVYQYNVPGDPGAIYLTLIKGRETEVVSGVNFGAIPNPNLIVEIEKINDIYYVMFPNGRSAKALYGKYASAASVPPHLSGEGTGSAEPVAYQRVMAGKVQRSTMGGLWVSISDFFYDNKNARENTTLELVAPVTSSRQYWAIVCVNSRDNEPVQVSTAESVSATYQQLYDVDIPAHYIPLAAVKLVTGQTTIDSSADIIDLRYFVTGKPVYDTKTPFFRTEDAETVAISGGVLTIHQSMTKVAAQTGTSDDLNTINSHNGVIAVFIPDAGDTITVTTSGNIITQDGNSVVLTGDDIMVAIGYNDNWYVIYPAAPPIDVSAIIDQILTDEDGNILVDEDGNVMTES